MEVAINWWAVVLATAASMAVGFVWYMPSVFGNTWMKLAKLDPKKIEGNGMRPILIAFAVSLVLAYVLAHFAFIANQYFHNAFFVDAVSVAFWAWAGFTAARFITHDSFEGRPFRLTMLNIAHELTTFLAMGAIIGWMGV